MRYENEHEIALMVGKFEDGSIAESEWRHAEHLVTACFYLSKHDFQTALDKMRSGILNLLKAFGADSSKYHETLTVAWMRIVDESRKSNNAQDIAKICDEICDALDRDEPLKYYSREKLYSDAARREFVGPDLAPLPVND